MNRSADTTSRRTSLLKSRIDRVQILCPMPQDGQLPVIPGFQVVWDHFVPCQTTMRTYSRVRHYTNLLSGTKVYAQYDPAAPWRAAVKLTFCPDDRTGLLRQELEEFLMPFPRYRMLTLEIYFDFSDKAGIDYKFIRRHALFGKSRRQTSGKFAYKLTYGSRKSTKFVRCYPKPELRAFRVELQLHSEWLRLRRIQTLSDLALLPRLIFPKQFRFARIDWDSLAAHLCARRDLDDEILQDTKRSSGSVHRVIRFLSREVGVMNPHGFLRTMKVAGHVRGVFRRWVARWCENKV